jgi:hypothetical protein
MELAQDHGRQQIFILPLVAASALLINYCYSCTTISFFIVTNALHMCCHILKCEDFNSAKTSWTTDTVSWSLLVSICFQNKCVM